MADTFDELFDAALKRGDISQAELDTLTGDLASGRATEASLIDEYKVIFGEIKRLSAEPYSPEAWNVEISEGLRVELHSLSRADLNGQQGMCSAWNPSKERFEVIISDTSIAVKPTNLRRAKPVTDECRSRATSLALNAGALLKRARGGAVVSGLGVAGAEAAGDSAGPLIAKAEQELRAGEQADPASPLVHLTKCDLAVMRGDRQQAAVHASRAVANRFADGSTRQHARMALANALGSLGDLAGEAKVLRAVLLADPENLHARLGLGQLLEQQGAVDDAIIEFMMALQLRADKTTPSSSSCAQDAAIRREAAHKLKTIYLHRVQRLVSAYDNEGMLTAIDKVTALHERFPEDVATRSNNTEEYEFVHPAHFLTYRVIAYLRLGRVAEADEVSARALAQIEEEKLEGTTVRPFALCTAGQVKERIVDEAGGEAALYAEAKALYLAAHMAGSDDPMTAECYKRVQAKMSPDIEFKLMPAQIGRDMTLSGAAKALRPFQFEELPPKRSRR